ncbi:MAG: class D sortase [Ruminococcus sp.]|nr:class D sortase [Ruminococcus sp.]
MKNNSRQSGGLLIHIATPFILAAICMGIIMIALIKPSDKLQRYKGLVFMDELKLDPENIGSGLIIKDNKIEADDKNYTSDEGTVIRPVYAEHYADIICDVFETTVPVYWGSDVELFEIGACQSSGSSVFGEPGNSVVSAHVNTFFAELDKLSVGDKITVKTNYGRFVYTVRETISFKDTNKKYVIPTEDTRLTLYTCSKDIFGASDERIGVICDLTESKYYSEREGE